jgi:hypothetical protein
MNEQRPAGIPGIAPPNHHSTPGLHPQPPRPATIPRPVQQLQPSPGAPRPVISSSKPQPAGDEPIALIDELAEVDEAPAAASKIKFGPDIGHKKHEWKRKPHVSGTGACRMKSFHAKYSDQGLEHLDDAVNEWLDEHPEVEVKFVTTTVHVFEGKIREPAIVMNVWY